MASEGRGLLTGLLAVAATYVSFLLHAQFAFLELMSRELGQGMGVRAVMAAMGIAGLAASLATGAALRVVASRTLMIAGFAGCAATALASIGCRTPLQFGVVAALVGAFTGMLTVSVASGLRDLLPGPRLGLKAGLGTGAAYFICNLPPLFHGGPVVQSIVAAAGCVAAATALLFVPAPAPLQASGRGSGGLASFATLVAAFLALVWLDSAAFRIVQETASLQGRSWAPGARTLLQGAAHLTAAVGAGHLLDRGRLRSLLLATFVLFASAFALLGAPAPFALGGPLYAAGIAIYSTALVVAPSLSEAALPRRLQAAVLYAVAGWIGSALGVGMAQDLHRIPPAFTAGAGVVILLGLVLSSAGAARAFRHAAAPLLALGAAGSLLALRPPAARELPSERGRSVYVAEGCIHCHSQYVRPGSASDIAAWGPMRSDQLEEHPPLLGTRRIGPDLLNVGNRRDSTWQEIHLKAPRALSPGSRMPSYAHLFAGDGRRGRDLVAYLGSLGGDTIPARSEATRDEPMPRAPADAELGRTLFAGSCAPCHGPAGRGDGPLAAQVASPFLDLAMPGLPRVERVTGDETLDLERLIRHGSHGTPMAGHELLTDLQLASLAARVRELRAEAAR